MLDLMLHVCLMEITRMFDSMMLDVLGRKQYSILLSSNQIQHSLDENNVGFEDAC